MTSVDSIGGVKPTIFQTLPTEVRYRPFEASDSIISLKVRKTSPNGFIQRMDDCLDSCWKGVKNFFIRIWRFIFCCCHKRPIYQLPTLKLEKLFKEGEIETMHQNWKGLGEKKWMEIIDGDCHKHGKYVFDRGLHGGSVEPGFIISFEENVVPLVERYLGTRTTPKFFLEVHKAACWHFDGSMNDTQLGQERIGVFRGEDDHMTCSYSLGKETTIEDWQEFLNFEPKLGKVKWTDETHTKLKASYIARSPEEIRAIMALMLDDFYNTIQQDGLATREKIRACAKLAKEMDWLHPPRDGATRTSLLILQKHLTEYVGHPAIVEDPHMMTKMGLERFTTYLENALERWEKEKSK